MYLIGWRSFIHILGHPWIESFVGVCFFCIGRLASSFKQNVGDSEGSDVLFCKQEMAKHKALRFKIHFDNRICDAKWIPTSFLGSPVWAYRIARVFLHFFAEPSVVGILVLSWRHELLIINQDPNKSTHVAHESSPFQKYPNQPWISDDSKIIQTLNFLHFCAVFEATRTQRFIVSDVAAACRIPCSDCFSRWRRGGCSPQRFKYFSGKNSLQICENRFFEHKELTNDDQCNFLFRFNALFFSTWYALPTRRSG